MGATTYEELKGSRAGATRGLNAGGENLLIRVKIGTDDISLDNDGHPVMPDPRGLVEANYIPLGSVHPWDGTKYVVGYQLLPLEEGASRTMRDVRVDFAGFNAAAPPHDGTWLISGRSTSVAETVFEEVPDPWSERGVDADEPDLAGLGPTVFKTTTEEDSEAYATVVDDAGQTEKKWLTRGTETPYPRKRQSRSVDMPAFSVTYTRIQANFRESMFGALAPYSKAVNKKKYRGAEPGHVKLEGMVFDPVEQLVTGQRTTNRAWRISLTFLWSDIPFTPYELVPLYDNQAVIYWRAPGPGHEADTKVVELRKVARRVDFEVLWRILNRA